MKQSTAMVGGEGNFIFLHPGPRTNDLVYHPLTFRPPQHTRDSSNCPRQLSSLPPTPLPLHFNNRFQPLSSTARSSTALDEKKKKPIIHVSSTESFRIVLINRGRLVEEFEKEKKGSRIIFFFFLRFVELLRSLSTPGNQADTVVFVSRNPIPQIHGSNRSSSIRADFSTMRGKERQGKLFSFPRRF